MNQHRFAPPSALICAAALAAVGLAAAPAPAPAQTLPAAAATTSVATTSAAVKGPSIAAAPADSRACRFDPAHDRLEYPLARVSRHFETDRAIKIVAIGSSSTAGAGASSPDASYPSQLEADLTKHFLWQDTTVLNRGVNGEEAPDMLARFDTSVIAEKPDLVIWQTGTNSVLRDHPLDPRATVLHKGLARLKAIHADVILVDPQFAPKVIAKPEVEGMVSQMAATAKELSVDLFHRFALMRHWYQADHLPFETFVSPDGLHMNDWSYACFAQQLGSAIEEAATRPTATAGLHRVHN
ncbi:MAG TPA: SGNH/GDSL hydrolase family protein [Xanthobacteraceae bacterium]|jgi:lysophospholipase L1-like esterase